MEAQENTKVRGMFRLQITEDDQVVGDSGWRENTITNAGFSRYLSYVFAGSTGSAQISHAALGTGGAPGAGDTTLAGEVTHAAGSRDAVTKATSSDSKAVRYTGTFASDTHNTTTVNIANIGLFQQSNTNSATIFAGATYNSSSWATNQAVNYTYDISFS